MICPSPRQHLPRTPTRPPARQRVPVSHPPLPHSQARCQRKPGLSPCLTSISSYCCRRLARSGTNWSGTARRSRGTHCPAVCASRVTGSAARGSRCCSGHCAMPLPAPVRAGRSADASPTPAVAQAGTIRRQSAVGWERESDGGLDDQGRPSQSVVKHEKCSVSLMRTARGS